MKKQDLRELATSELVERLAAEKQSLKMAQLNHKVTPVEDNSQLRKSRRQIARMETILNQKNSK